MRILHLDAGREMRGGQWQVLRLLEGLAAEGVESTLLARPESPLYAAALQAGRRVEKFGLLRLIQVAARYDAVHAHDSHSHTLAAFAFGGPLIVSRRVAFRRTGLRPVRLKYARPRHYIAVSEFVKSVLIGDGIPAAKISVVYDGVPLLEQSEGKLILAPAYAGDPAKCAPLALEAARLAGVDLKFSPTLERDLRDAAILVYITRSEGLGSGALMAMSAGVPVVASKVGGLPEIVEHRQTGLLVENQPAAIAAAIRELQENPDFARRLGMAARRRVTENFTVQHMVRRTIDIYRQVLT